MTKVTRASNPDHSLNFLGVELFGCLSKGLNYASERRITSAYCFAFAICHGNLIHRYRSRKVETECDLRANERDI